MSYIIEHKTDTFTLRINLSHYYEIWKIRKPNHDDSQTNINLPDHPLLKKKLLDKETKQIYNISQVCKHWYGGWYIVLVKELNNSHGLIFWESINCINPDILNQIKESQAEYSIL